MPSLREAILEKLDGFTNLPSLNETASKVQEAIGSSDYSATAIGKIIEKDMGLSAKVLKIANSVFFAGKYGQIGDLGQAVARLGIKEVSQICTTVGSMQLFSKMEGSIDLREFWRHSLGVAIVMRHIANRADRHMKYSANSYAAGLFHDIGILVLDRFFSSRYEAVLDREPKESRPLFEQEQLILGIDHAEIGSLVCKKWKLPEEICNAVAWHHTPDACPEEYRRIAQLIHIANFTCSVLGIPEPGDGAVQMGSAGAWHDLGLDKCDLNEIAEDVKEGIERGGVFLSLSL